MTKLPLFDRPTAVYRLFAPDDSLLYVGISWNPTGRLSGHRTDKTWWPEVARTTIAWCRNRIAALAEEAHAIAKEKPRYNVARPDPRRYPAREPKFKSGTYAKRMGYEHAASVLRMPAELLRRSTEAGFIPHACDGDKVWFSPKHIRQAQALYTPEQYALAADPDKPRRAAELSLRAQACSHAAA